MCLINADFFPNHHVSCCEINSAPQNHKELRVVMIPVKDLYTQHMNPNMQLIKRLFPPMKKFSINWCQFEFFPCMWKDFRFINNYMDLSDQFFKIFLLVIAEVWKHEIWRTKRKWDAELGLAGPTMTITIKKTVWMSKSVKIMSQSGLHVTKETSAITSMLYGKTILHIKQTIITNTEISKQRIKGFILNQKW